MDLSGAAAGVSPMQDLYEQAKALGVLNTEPSLLHKLQQAVAAQQASNPTTPRPSTTSQFAVRRIRNGYVLTLPGDAEGAYYDTPVAVGEAVAAHLAGIELGR